MAETVYNFGVVVSDVAALIGHVGTIGASTSPNSTAVSTWITETASMVNGHLRGRLGITPSTLTAESTGASLELYHACRDMICRYVAAKWHVANRLGDTDMAKSYRIQFDQWIAGLHTDRQGTTGGAAAGPSFRTNINSTTSTASRWRSNRSYR